MSIEPTDEDRALANEIIENCLQHGFEGNPFAVIDAEEAAQRIAEYRVKLLRLKDNSGNF